LMPLNIGCIDDVQMALSHVATQELVSARTPSPWSHRRQSHPARRRKPSQTTWQHEILPHPVSAEPTRASLESHGRIGACLSEEEVKQGASHKFRSYVATQLRRDGVREPQRPWTHVAGSGP
jgi:hypothetical protein